MLILFLQIIVDAFGLIFIVAAVNDNEQLDFAKAAMVGFAISVVCGVVAYVLGKIGILAVLLGFVPLAGVAGIVAWVSLGLTLPRAMTVGALFLGFINVRGWLFSWVFSS